MEKMESIRETVSGPLDPDYFQKRTEAGWELAAVEWRRPSAGQRAAPVPRAVEVPFGARVAPDCGHLEDDPLEMNALMLILELIVQDRSLAAMADALNESGFRTRDGSQWSVVTVYKMLPRLIEASPRIFTTEAWIERRKKIAVAG